MASDDRTLRPAPDLGLLFATNARDLEAVKVFVNRQRELEAFDEAVRVHWRLATAPDFDSQDVLTPRRNVMTFYGLGGVGKTSLSRALEQRYAGSDPDAEAGRSRPFAVPVAGRIDLASEVGMDFERVLLCIRVAVARLGRPMHAFDIAFSRYWEQVHPNESIADYLRSDGRLARIAGALHLPEQITNGIGEVAETLGGSSTLVAVVAKLTRAITGSVRGRVVKRHAVQECHRLAALLAADPDLDSLSYYPHLLSWDLARLSRARSGNFHVVIFVDTFEDITQGEQRRFERLFNRLVWLMPNVLFVICSRNRLDWADPTAEGVLDWSGPISWPGLDRGATGEPTQHLVGHLSWQDASTFLSQRLRRGGQPAIPAEIRDRIAADSGGYPLYLDLAVARYMQLTGSGTDPAPEDFRGGFPALVTRLLRDLTGEERRLLRVLSLLDSFDAEMAARIADLPSEMVAIRLTHRAFVDLDERAPFPYSIHRLLRQEVRRADAGPDAFSPDDWARYARRAFDELGVRYREASQTGDRPVVISALNQALRLADEFRLDLGWCVDAAFSFVGDSLWESSLRPLVALPAATPAAALARTLQAIVDRQADRRASARVLGEVLDSGLLTGDVHDLALYYRAETLRETGQGEESEALVRALVSRETRVTDLAAKGLLHRLRRLGRFTEAQRLIASRPDAPLWRQMAGTLYWTQGMLAEAAQQYQAARDAFRRDDRPGHAAEVDGCLAYVAGLRAGEADQALVTAGVTALASSRNTWARLMAQLGAAMLAAGGGTGTEQELHALDQQGEAAGLTSIQAYARFGACLNAALSGDGDRLRQARGDLAGWVVAHGDFRWLVEIVDFWIHPPLADAQRFAGSDWLGGAATAGQRWRRVLSDRVAARLPAGG